MGINATIVTIGDELLIGQTVDTNSAFIGQELNKIGIRVFQRLAVGDDATQITEALQRASAQSQLVLLTGGLGPTKDDITKKTIAEYFGVGFTFYEEVWERMKAIFEKRGKEVLEMNRSQAMLPSNAVMLPNQRGTAQGMWFDENGVVFISMPGVPHEMRHLMEQQILPRLQKHYSLPKIVHRSIMTSGAGESSIANMLKDFEDALPDYMKLAYLPELGVVKLRLSAYGEATESEVEERCSELKTILKDYVFSDIEITLQEQLGKMLLAESATLAAAESCTGGYLSHLITSIPGSSSYYLGGVVSYHNDLKTDILDVAPETILQHGAVSEAVVSEMVRGILNKTDATYGIAISGVAGPAGGTPEKPVGTVCFGIGNRERIITRKYHFFPSRMENIKVSANTAMNLLRRFMIGEI